MANSPSLWFFLLILPAALLDFFLIRQWQKKRAKQNLPNNKIFLFLLISSWAKFVKSFFTMPVPDPQHPEIIPWTIFTFKTKLMAEVDDDKFPDDIHHQNVIKNIFLKNRKLTVQTILLISFNGTAVLGQYHFLNYPAGEKMGLIAYVLASLLLIILIWLNQSQTKDTIPDNTSKNALLFIHWKEIQSFAKTHPVKTGVLITSFLLTVVMVISLFTHSTEQSYWDIFLLWLGSWLIYTAVFISFPRIKFRSWFENNKTDLLIIFGFFLIGGFCRFYALGKIPNIIDGDEGRFGTIILDIMNGKSKNMFGTVFGNSSLYFFFLAGLMKLFGANTTILRLGSAIGGTLLIPFLYLFAKNFFNRRVALISTALLTVSNFHIHFSRIMSVTSIQDAFFATTTLFWFYSGLKYQSRNRMLLAGLTLGLWLYVYMGARLIILLIPLYLLCLYWFDPALLRNNIKNLGFFAGEFGLMALPMMVWGIQNPEMFNIRANQVGILQSGWLAKEALFTGLPQWQIFLTQFKQAFLTTIYYPSYGFHFSSWPMLDPFSAIFFVTGMIFMLMHTRDSKYLLINGWFWSGVLVGGALVLLPSSNTYRILIVFPAVCLMVGVGFNQLSLFLEDILPMTKMNLINSLGSIVFIIIISIFNLKTYYFSALYCKYENPNTRLASLIGTYTGNLDPEVVPYLLTAPRLQSTTHLSLSFLSHGHEYKQYEEPLRAPPKSINPEQPAVFFFIPERESEIRWIKQVLPGGITDQILDCKIKVADVYLWVPPD